MSESNRQPRLAGKVAIVTGAGRNIGRAEALLLAREGAKVVVNDLGGGSGGGGADASVAQATVDEIEALGGEAVAQTSSIGTMTGAKELIDAALDAYGRIDILINNAGIARALRIDDTPEDAWDAVVGVNLKGSYATIHHAAPHFIRQKSGVIVNTSSPSGFGQYANAAYVAAKEGVIGLTRAVARDLGQFGVRCNAIRPIAAGSSMGTPQMIEAILYSQNVLDIPAIWNRWSGKRTAGATPDNVAALAVWLCTDRTANVNGRDFFVAGEEIGILPEPELSRASFKTGGWDIDSLDDESSARYLIGDAVNRFSGKKP